MRLVHTRTRWLTLAPCSAEETKAISTSMTVLVNEKQRAEIFGSPTPPLTVLSECPA